MITKRTKSILITLSIGLALLLSLATLLPNAAEAKGGKKLDKVAPHLRQKANNGEMADVVIQLNGPMSKGLDDLLKRNGIKLKKHFQNFNSASIELPVSVLDELAEFEEVDFVTNNDEFSALGHVSSTTGADDVRAASNSSDGNTTLDGTGIGIAIVDSGLYTDHKSIGSRVTYSKDFTGENRTDDPFGHGTHVASAAAGNGALYNGDYVGIAPNAHLINLRVLNTHGRGTMASVLSALDWIYSNRASYQIRVVNLSLGGPAINSYTRDPLCIAVRKLVDAGIVVVAAAGNDGKDAFGRKVFGGIHSPGNEPSAITVGATNTFGTNQRGDDSVTTYSSRGPTRSFWTDRNGVAHFDNLVKPELVAPGNKLIFAQAANNYLVTADPSLDTGIGAGRNNQKMMYLSGTSVSSPLVAGAAALVLQANPKLTPNMVKMLLSFTAQQLPNVNTLEQGAGQLNIAGAVKLAKLVRTDLTNKTALGSTLLTASAPAAQSTIDGTTFTWSQGLVSDHGYLKGLTLITKYQQIYDLGVLISDATLTRSGVLISDNTMISSGVLVSDYLVISDGTTLGSGPGLLPSGVLISDGVLLGDGVLISDGVLIGDGVLISDGVLIGDGVLISDGVLLGDSVRGDATACMK